MTAVIEESQVVGGVPLAKIAQAEAAAPVVRAEGQRAEVAAPRERIPFGVPRGKLGVLRGIPGYHLHWLNDVGSRIQEAIAGGYEFVMRDEVSLMPGVVPSNSELGDRVSRIVGAQEEGNPVRAYLMKIKEEWWQESQAAVQSQVDKTDRAIRKGVLGIQPGDQNSLYGGTAYGDKSSAKA